LVPPRERPGHSRRVLAACARALACNVDLASSTSGASESASAGFLGLLTAPARLARQSVCAHSRHCVARKAGAETHARRHHAQRIPATLALPVYRNARIVAPWPPPNQAPRAWPWRERREAPSCDHPNPSLADKTCAACLGANPRERTGRYRLPS
jgi:hypothetical protein